jgi:hypothetical protein
VQFERNMSRLPSILAKGLGVSVRTFERWCARGNVPGAYQTKGGHWRIRRPSEQLARKHGWNRTPGYFESRKGRITEQLLLYCCPPPPLSPELERLIKSPAVLYGMTHGRELMLAVETAMAAHEISDMDRSDPNLAQREPGKYRLLNETPVGQVVRDYWQAATNPHAPLMTAATRLRLNQRKATATTLARELGISRRALYNPPFGRDAVRRACALGSPGRVVLPLKPKIRTGVRLPKAA